MRDAQGAAGRPTLEAEATAKPVAARRQSRHARINQHLKTLLSILFSTLIGTAMAQTITVSGRVTDPAGRNTLINIMVVNQQSGNGTFAGAGGAFTITANRTDTIMITARDYAIKKICFRDSAGKSRYTVLVKLDSLHYQLPDVYVHPQRSLPEIDKDKSTLGQIPSTNINKEITATSPITALYERFSRIEQSKRKVAQLEDEEKRREILKDLFHLYIRNEIINLSDDAFDNFIDYCNFSDEFIKNATDYELIMAVKQKYDRYNRATSNDYYNR